MDQNLLQIGAVAILFLFAIKEFFAYLRSRKESSNGNGNNIFGKAILSELQTMNSNHLHTLQDTVDKGNCRLVDIIHNDNTKIIELLSEIKGALRK